jgi:hypothetical protein
VTDWFLQQVIEQASALKVPATVTFLPDHGEASPYLDGGAVGHDAAHYVAAEFEIPAFIWVNAAHRTAHPDKVAALQANAAREIRSGLDQGAPDARHTRQAARLSGLALPRPPSPPVAARCLTRQPPNRALPPRHAAGVASRPW